MKRLLKFMVLVACVAMGACADKKGDINEGKGDGDIQFGHTPKEYDGPTWIVSFCDPEYQEPDAGWAKDFWMSVNLHGERCCTAWNNVAEFNTLCQKYGDTNYKGDKRVVEGVYPGNYNPQALTTNYTSIEIVAPLDDFDEEHPAGTSLNDLVRVRYSTLYPFIRDGYNVQPDTSYTDGYLECDKKLTDITAEDLRLLGPNLRFNFSKTPPYAMKIFMQIILTDEYGQKHVLEKNIFNDNYEYKQPGGF